MRMRYLAAGLSLALLLAGCGTSSGDGLKTSGTIMATDVSVATEVAGKVTDLLVQEGQKVKQGDPVAKLDPAALKLQLDQAKAALDSAQAKLADAKAGARPEQIRQVQELANQAAAARSGAQKNYDTVSQLFKKGAATQAQLDAAKTQLDTATAQAKAAQAQVDLVKTGSTPDQIKQLQAAVDQAQAAVSLAQLNVDRTTVKAPVDGVVASRLAEPGSLLPTGGAIVKISELDDLWIKVYVPEDQLALVKLGQTVNVSVDAYPSRAFQAKVTQIADQAEFTPRNVQTKEERATTVYAVKLKLLEGLGGELKPGMPADVSLAPVAGGN